MESKKIRLNKLIADSGLCSRRQADQLIADGAVKRNGRTVFELGVQVDPTIDQITVNGKPLPAPSSYIYLMANKPKGMLTTTEDEHGRPIITDLVKKLRTRVFPVGRLDWDSEGMILLTNNGEFANRVMHPSHEITKTYLVKVEGEVTTVKIDKLLNGVSIEGARGKVKAREVEKISKGKSDSKYSWFRVVITDGKNRQIRKMFEKIRCDVIKLQRVAIGRLHLGTLKKGEVRILDLDDLEKIFFIEKKRPQLTSEAKEAQALERPKTGQRSKSRGSSSQRNQPTLGGTRKKKVRQKSIKRP